MIFIKLFAFIIFIVKKLNIDESHGLLHSMQVLNYAHEIYESEIKNNSYINKYENIIYISAILHDMCDKKYIKEEDGIKEIEIFLNEEICKEDCDIIKTIITTMSYSTVKKNGFPILYEIQLPYHIVREADLLASLDFDRCMAYKMLKMNGNIYESFYEAIKLFNERMYKHKLDNLYITKYAKDKDIILQYEAQQRINNWKKILKIIL
jgi:hypothetical protein